MKWKLTLCEPDVTQKEIEAVIEIFKKNWYTMGQATIDFEQSFSEMMKVSHAYSVSNGTAALHLANIACGVQPGDEVICPALTFVATANASLYQGAEVVFADSISETDLTIDPEDIKRKITPRTKAISVVHYAGFSCNMEEILAIARENNLKVIEDCAHSPLAEYKFSDGSKKTLGSIGNVGCYSFYGNKNMTTGEGGMVTTNSDETAADLKLYRSHGMTSLTFDRHNKHASGYDIVKLGYNYRIDEIRAAMGLSQLKRLERNTAERRRLFRIYADVLSHNSNIIVPFADRDISLASPHVMSIIIKENRNGIRQALFDNRIQTSKHYDLIPNFTLYKNHEFRSKIKYIDNLLTVPLYPGMTEDDVEFVCSIINNVSEK